MKADIKTIEELMKVLHEQKLTEVSYEDTNFKVTNTKEQQLLK